MRLNKLMAKVWSSLSPIHTCIYVQNTEYITCIYSRICMYIAQHQSHLSNWKIDFRFYEMLLRKMCIYSFDICKHQTKAKSTFNLKVHNYENPLLAASIISSSEIFNIHMYIHIIRKCDAIVLISPSSTSRRHQCFVKLLGKSTSCTVCTWTMMIFSFFITKKYF